ncbi:MAG: hypothetical protein ACUVTU_00895 [Desulfurispora sp.]|uniref:hypothetical protein n=1 Tax=Desulfurispora sp. TaxID=3014275 RepID=UPI0040499CD2
MPRHTTEILPPQKQRDKYFVPEPTGSAPAVNLDGQTDHPYTDQILDELGRKKKEK